VSPDVHITLPETASKYRQPTTPDTHDTLTNLFSITRPEQGNVAGAKTSLLIHEKVLSIT
jgi:hypothetical protein